MAIFQKKQDKNHDLAEGLALRPRLWYVWELHKFVQHSPLLRHF